MYEHTITSGFYFLLRLAIIGAREVNRLRKLINEQTVPCIMGHMPPLDWNQWAKERPSWAHDDVEEPFWRFIQSKMERLAKRGHH
jgi:hypothetical protein